MFATYPTGLWTLPSVGVFLSPRCPAKSGSAVTVLPGILWFTGLRVYHFSREETLHRVYFNLLETLTFGGQYIGISLGWADTFKHSLCCFISCWAGKMGGACLHLGQRWTPVSPCSTMWQQTDFSGFAHISPSLLQQARQRGTTEGWKVVFVSRSLPPHSGSLFGSTGCFLTLTNACVTESGPWNCRCGPQSLLTPGGARLLKNQQQWPDYLPSACLHLSSEKDVLSIVFTS